MTRLPDLPNSCAFVLIVGPRALRSAVRFKSGWCPCAIIVAGYCHEQVAGVAAELLDMAIALARPVLLVVERFVPSVTVDYLMVLSDITLFAGERHALVVPKDGNAFAVRLPPWRPPKVPQEATP
jgi:hypothetical protein